MKRTKFQLTAGTGMALGVACAAFIALMFSLIAGNQAIWSWAIPVGLAVGLAIGAGRNGCQEKG